MKLRGVFGTVASVLFMEQQHSGGCKWKYYHVPGLKRSFIFTTKILVNFVM